MNFRPEVEIMNGLGLTIREKMCRQQECHVLSSDSIPVADRQRIANLRENLAGRSQYRGCAEIRPVQMFERN